MTSKTVTGIRIKDGKIQRVHRLSVSQRIGSKAKADRQEAAWTKKSKLSPAKST